jgi:hypothetical protein
MTLKYQRLRLTGLSPIILHNPRTANPLDPFSKALKAISSKRSKTDSDHRELMRLQWYAALYQSKEGQIILPGMMIEACLVNGAKKNRLGTAAKAGMFVDENPQLIFDGCALSADELWERGDNELTVPCNVQKSKIMRTRFIAHEWSTEFTLTYDDGLFNKAQVIDIVEIAGLQIAIGTWRPRHGRFTVEALK